MPNFLTKNNEQKYIQKNKFQGGGFTLIELLIVIAIIGILASVVLVNLNGARQRAKDARKQMELKSLSMGLRLFYEMKGMMPLNYNPCCGACEGDASYNQSMQELVDAGIISSIPASPVGSIYCYYDYGPDNSVGAILVTDLPSSTPSTTGLAGSCRPWGAGTNWCSQSVSTAYCICTTYP